MTRLAGTSRIGSSVDGGPASEAQLNSPPRPLRSITPENTYIADYGNHRLLKVSANGVITNGSWRWGSPRTRTNPGNQRLPRCIRRGNSMARGRLTSRNRAAIEFGKSRQAGSSAQGPVMGRQGNQVMVAGDERAGKPTLRRCARQDRKSPYFGRRLRCDSKGHARRDHPHFFSDAQPKHSERFGSRLSGNPVHGQSMEQSSRQGFFSGNRHHGSGSRNRRRFRATAARPPAPNLNGPWDVAADRAGNLFIADSANNGVRKVSSSHKR